MLGKLEGVFCNVGRSSAAFALSLMAPACTEITGGDGEHQEELTSSVASTSSGLPYTMAAIPGLPAATFPLGINNRGTIVGWLRTESGNMQAFSWHDGSVTGLPGLGGPTSSAEDVNQRGIIVGHADNEDGYPRAVMWRRGRVTDLGTLGGNVSFATAINDRGQVVGTAETAAGDLHAFVWSMGEMTDLGGLPGSEFSWAEDLNNRGMIVGWSAGGFFVQRATMWEGGEIVDLGTLAHESAASSINDRHQIVGGSILELEVLALLWERGEMRMLGTLGGTFSAANAINAAGQVVGASAAADGRQAAFLWERGTMISLGRPESALRRRAGALSNAFAINARGTVVGFSGRPVTWTAVPRRGSPRSPASARAETRASRPESWNGGPPRWAATFCNARENVRIARPRGIDIAAGCDGAPWAATRGPWPEASGRTR